jgi:hypothetical protein
MTPQINLVKALVPWMNLQITLTAIDKPSNDHDKGSNTRETPSMTPTGINAVDKPSNHPYKGIDTGNNPSNKSFYPVTSSGKAFKFRDAL